jgi:hypothetical protein
MFKIIALQISELNEDKSIIKSNTRFGEAVLNGISFNVKKKYFILIKNHTSGINLIEIGRN